MNEFSAESKTILGTCHDDLVAIMQEAIRISPIDFGIVYGHRSPDLQLELFKHGREFRNGKWIITDPKKVVTNSDGTTNLSNHNYTPSRAVDIRIFIDGRPDLAYDPEHLSHVAGIVLTVGAYLYDRKLISHRIRWGGNWDGDGIILQDQTLWDRPHFEIIV